VSVRLKLAKGGDADVVELAGDRVVLSSTSPAPPGAPLDAALEDGTPLRIKVRGCHKSPPQSGGADEGNERWHIEGRVIDLSRALREKLSAKP
jgi:hypothetical protein